VQTILVTATEREGMVCKAVQLSGSSDSDYQKVVSILGAKHARIVGFIDDSHCIWAGNSHDDSARPVFAIGSDELSVNGPLLVTGFDQDDDRMVPALMTEADIKAWDIHYTRMSA
jgi:hypothetical protein